MPSEIHAKPSDKNTFYLYFSLYDPVSEDSAPVEGKVGWCSFDQRVYSITYDGKIRGLAVYDRKLTDTEKIAHGLHRDYDTVYTATENQINLITSILETEKQWCEVKNDTHK